MFKNYHVYRLTPYLQIHLARMNDSKKFYSFYVNKQKFLYQKSPNISGLLSINNEQRIVAEIGIKVEVSITSNIICEN